MFGFKRFKKNSVTDLQQDNTAIHQAAKKEEQNLPAEGKGFFTKLKQGLRKTRDQITGGIAQVFLGKKVIDQNLLEELETQLLVADLGIEVVDKIIAKITTKLSRNELADSEALLNTLKQELKIILQVSDNEAAIYQEISIPKIILVVGVNGVGKTTTIGKLARFFQSDGKKVMLAAGDTFRAAAVEQLQIWGERNNIPVIAQPTGYDSASVIFDAISAAKARGIDILLADTAGRLHTQDNLMKELQKIKRVIKKIDPEAPHETLLVIDASTGQNAINQAKQFHEAIGLTGIVITKLDGTAKGGIVFAIADTIKIPIRYIGVGEQLDDLRPFVIDEFVEALFSKEN